MNQVEVSGVETRSSEQNTQPPYSLSYIISPTCHNVQVPGEAALQATNSIL